MEYTKLMLIYDKNDKVIMAFDDTHQYGQNAIDMLNNSEIIKDKPLSMCIFEFRKMCKDNGIEREHSVSPEILDKLKSWLPFVSNSK